MMLRAKVAYWVFVALLAVNAVVCCVQAWQRSLEPNWGQDLQAVYKASRIWLHGRNPYHAYSAEEWTAITGEPAGPVLPVISGPSTQYPPVALVVAASVSWMSWENAKLGWLLLNCGFAVLAPFWFWRISGSVFEPRVLLIAALLWFGSIALRVGIANGQHALLAVTALLGMFWYLRLGRDSMAGLLLALSFHKYQVAPVFVLLLLAKGRYRVLVWAGVISALVMALFFARIDAPVGVVVAGFLESYRFWLENNWANGLDPNSAFDVTKLVMVESLARVLAVAGAAWMFWKARGRRGFSVEELACGGLFSLWSFYSPVYHGLLLLFSWPVLAKHRMMLAAIMTVGIIGLGNHPERVLGPDQAAMVGLVFDRVLRATVLIAFVAIMLKREATPSVGAAS